MTFQELLDDGKCEGDWYTMSKSWVQRHLGQEILGLIGLPGGDSFCLKVEGLTTFIGDEYSGFLHFASPKRFSVRKVGDATAKKTGQVLESFGDEIAK